MDPLSSVEVDWFRWVMSGVGTVLVLIVRGMTLRQDKLDEKLEVMEKAQSAHELLDERQFVKKEEMREMYKVLKADLAELKDNQETNVNRLMERIDQIVGRYRRPGA